MKKGGDWSKVVVGLGLLLRKQAEVLGAGNGRSTAFDMKFAVDVFGVGFKC
ncbi:MAG: hypothetical protein GY943_11295, partial [Chloroflexi bacterium]|nr:hypothetical protein [Chloroflexota bacterium]